MEQTVNQTQQTVIDDPWDSAENPVFRASEYWGQVNLDMWYCVLEKGVGKIQFDPQSNRIEDRRTAIDISLDTLPEQNITFEVSRSMIAESAEWAKIVLPSIKALGLSPRELNGKWVKLHFKPTSRKYTNSNGEERENTTFEFLALFPDEIACRADFAGGPSTNGSSSASVTIDPGDKEKQTAFAFLKVIVEKAAKGKTDLEAIRAEIAKTIVAYPMVAKVFTVDSPETVQLIMDNMAPF